MFKLYNEISALGKFSRGMCTEYIDFVDSMCWFEYDFGVGYVCPEKTDYWFGHCLDLYHVREDVTGEKLAVMWGQYLAPHAAKAVKKGCGGSRKVLSIIPISIKNMGSSAS